MSLSVNTVGIQVVELKLGSRLQPVSWFSVFAAAARQFDFLQAVAAENFNDSNMAIHRRGLSSSNAHVVR